MTTPTTQREAHERAAGAIWEYLVERNASMVCDLTRDDLLKMARAAIDQSARQAAPGAPATTDFNGDALYAAWHKVGADVAGLRFADFIAALGSGPPVAAPEAPAKQNVDAHTTSYAQGYRAGIEIGKAMAADEATPLDGLKEFSPSEIPDWETRKFFVVDEVRPALARAPLPELVAAADAVVERWHSRDWKQPHTADFIARLAAAVGAAKRGDSAPMPAPNEQDNA